MQWIGKLVGAALGLPFGPVGIALGAVLGHQFDRGLGGPVLGAASGARQAFFVTTFEVMGHVAKADGRVSEHEIQSARRVMHSMRLNPEQVRQAIDCFNAGKQAGYPLGQRIHDLARRSGQRREIARVFLEIQLRSAIGAGEISQNKRELLWVIAQRLAINRVELAQMEAALRGGQGRRVAAGGAALEAAYRTLGVSADASDQDVKTAYRRLMNRHHPDKMIAQGLPDSMTAVAEEKTQAIRAAYDRVKAARGFR